MTHTRAHYTVWLELNYLCRFLEGVCKRIKGALIYLILENIKPHNTVSLTLIGSCQFQTSHVGWLKSPGPYGTHGYRKLQVSAVQPPTPVAFG